jgi:hypothetical protein
MTTLFQATDAEGRHVEIDAVSVRALAPTEDRPDQTTLFLDDKTVTVDGRYESLIAEFAAMWPMHAL